MFIFLLTIEALGVLSLPEAEYQIFPGFDLKTWTHDDATKDLKTTEAPETSELPKALLPPNVLQNLDDPEAHRVPKSPEATQKVFFKHPPKLKKLKKHNQHRSTSTPGVVRMPHRITTVLPLSHSSNQTVTPKLNVKFSCPEDEKPSNIGPYEVPTQRDLVLLTKKTLQRIYGSYHENTMLFLEHIRKATRATKEVEKKCLGNKSTYRRCVRHVSSKCETITKSLTIALELQRQDVLAFGEKDFCSLKDMKEDPIELIKMMASEEASLEFALPGFLRLLNACSAYCISLITGDSFKAMKPSRYLTDTDVVIRHFLTRKHYMRLVPNQIKPGIKIKKKILK